MKNILKKTIILCFIAAIFLMAGCSENKDDSAYLEGRTLGNYQDLTAGPAVARQEGRWNVEKLSLFDVDISLYTIVTTSEPGESAMYSATELQKYIAKATGYILPILPDTQGENKHEIVIGTTNRSTDYIEKHKKDLGADGYLIAQDHMKLFLCGESDRGTLYAVYSFLEEYVGWGFFSSTCEVIKENRHCQISKDIYQRKLPAFKFRTAYWKDVMDNGDFAAKLKFNFNTSARHGGRFTYSGGLAHTLGRLSGTGHEVNVQPCLTDPEVYRTVLNNVRAELQAHPDATIISISQNDSDSLGLGCQCADCKAIDDAEGTPMGSLLTFVNKIATELKDEFPDVYFHTLSYRYTRTPPKTIKPADNVLICLCSIECCFCHPFEECDHTGFIDDLKGWAEITDNLYIWDYTTNFANYMAPFPNFNSLRKNTALFADCNVIGLFEQGNYQSYSTEFAELRSYLISKLMWDPYMSEEVYDKHMDTFLEGYYGEGWKYIKEYITIINDQEDMVHKHIYDSPATLINYTSLDAPFHRDKIGFLLSFWDRALDLAKDQEEYDRIKKSRMQLIYCQMILEWNDAKDAPIAEDFFNDCLKYNITYINEGRKLNKDLKIFTVPISNDAWTG